MVRPVRLKPNFAAGLQIAGVNQDTPLDPTFAPSFPSQGVGPFTGIVAAASPGAAPTIDLTAFFLHRTMTFNRICFAIGASAGNLDVGIYDDDGASGLPGTRLVSSGATACPAASASIGRSITISATTLSPGWYYAAFARDNTGSTLYYCNVHQAWSVRPIRANMTGASTLPNPAVGAAVVNVTTAYIIYPSVA